MTASIPLSVREASKRFGQILAVDRLSFEVAAGECFGLLGPNGAGKTTTLSMAATLIRPDSGSILVAGADVAADPAAARRAIGLAPQEISLYPDLTARENLAFFGGLYGVRGGELKERIREALDLAGLADRASHRVGTFSGGMKRRLNFVVALIHRPALVLLDEPTAGVDPQSRNHLFDMVADLKARGITIVYTTHYMEEAERLCDRIAIMDHGRLAGVGTQAELVRRVGAEEQVELSFREGTTSETPAVRRALDGLSYAPRNGGVAIPVAGETALQDILARCAAAGVPLRSVTMRKPDLETVFLSLTGRELRD
jgi:ABC-2 type transport system ATP-binding protein